jgi:hypothetical protein
MRTYLAVEDIHQAVKKAEECGATIAYPPTRQGNQAILAIVIHGGVEHGLSCFAPVASAPAETRGFEAVPGTSAQSASSAVVVVRSSQLA